MNIKRKAQSNKNANLHSLQAFFFPLIAPHHPKFFGLGQWQKIVEKKKGEMSLIKHEMLVKSDLT